MRVLVVSGGKPTERDPLNGNFEYDQAKALASQGLEVFFFAIDLRSFRRKRPWGIFHGQDSGVFWHVISLPIGAVPLLWLCKFGGWALLFLFNKVFRNKLTYPDIIHAHFTEMGCMSAGLSSKYNIPLIITEHSSLMNRPNIDPNLLKCAKIGYNQAKKVIAVSNPLKNNILIHTGVEAKVIPNMINLESFNKAKKIVHSGYHIVSTGNLIPRKRFANLIKAFAEMIQNHDDVYLHIIGDGYMRDELVLLATNLGINDNVIFHGYKNAAEMTSIYEQCDCFALVSALETFGVVYVEAMAAGLPVIATRCGGPEDFVNESNGVLIEVDNHKELYNALEYVYLNARSFSSEDIRTFAEMNFSPKMVASKIIDVYNDL